MSNGSVPPERDGDSPDGDEKAPRPRNYTGVILVVLIIAVCFLVFQNTVKGDDPITFPAFQKHLLDGKVEKVSVEQNKIKFTLTPDDGEETKVGREQTVIAPAAVIAGNTGILEEMAELGAARSQEPVTDDQATRYLARVVHDDATPPAIYRRFILKSSKNNLLELLVEMTRPPTDGAALDLEAAPGVFLLRSGEVTYSDKTGSSKNVALSWQDLLLATAGMRNGELALPPASEVTTTIPAGVLQFDEGNSFLETLLIGLAPWLIILLFFWFFILRQMRNSGGIGGNVLSFGRSRARVANREKTQITFNDVAGIDEAKEEVSEIVEFLKHPGRFSRLGGRTPRGVLLVGPPGNGKTLLAKAIAGEADVPFFSICGSDFVEMFVGVGASRVRDLFKQAKENSPCLIFLDEIDAVGRRRGAGLGGGHDEREQTLNAILVEMDGFETDAGVIVIAATNRADVLDPALLRPGRFDREISVDLPDLNGRQAILDVHAKKVKMHPSVDLEAIARGTPGFSGAELEALINEAAIIAVMHKKDAVFIEDLEEARDRVRFGRAKRSQILDEEDRKVTAYHEAGHTLMSWLEPKADPPHKVTIIPRGHALGSTMTLPDKDRYGFTVGRAEARLRVLMGGRVAEEIFFDEITSGASNDIKVATDLATHMVREWGMSEALGPISYAENEETVFLGRDMGRGARFSEATVELIDSEVKRILRTAHEETATTLETHREKIVLLARNLLEFETLTRQEIDGVLDGEAVEDIRARVAEATREVERREVVEPRPEPPPAFEPPGPLAGEGAT